MKREKGKKREIGRRVGVVKELSTRTSVLTVMVFAVAARIVFNAIFLGRYGAHAMGNPETWYYYGVAEGRYQLNLFDPTYYLFKLLGFLFSGTVLLHSVIASSILLTSLTAVLIYFLVRKTQGQETALGAALIYSLLGNPFELSVASFTHDFFQLPLMIISWFLLLGIVSGAKYRRIILALILIFLLIPGFAVGPLCMATVGVAVFFFLRQLIRFRLRNTKLKDSQKELVFIGILVLITVIFRYFLYPRFWETISFFAQRLRGLNISLQRRAGSADLMPISLAGYWVQYGFLLFLLPFGFIISFKKKDALTISNFFVSIIAGMIALRGTRAMDISIAIFAGAALANWKKEWFLPGIVLPALAVPYVIARKYYPSHDVIYAAGICAVLAALALKKGKKLYYLPLTAACVFSLLVSYFKVIPSGPNIPEEEYQLLTILKGKTEEGEKIAVGTWDRGYFAEVVSGMDGLTSPGYIDKELNEFFWQPEEIAAVNFLRKKARYVIISERDFKLVAVDKKKNEFRCSHAGGFIMPSPRPSFILFKELLTYKLLYDEKDLKYFTLLKETKDSRNEGIIRLYRVEDPFPESGQVLVSVRILMSGAHSSPFKITARLENRETGDIAEESRMIEFGKEEIKTVSFRHDISGPRENFEIMYAYNPIIGYLKGTYRNRGGARQTKIVYTLVNTESGIPEEKVEELIDFKGGEKKTVKTKVSFREAGKNYRVELGMEEGIERLSLEAIKPELSVLFKGAGYYPQESEGKEDAEND